ncbi:alpha/beta fold hydrolase [Spirilliplanes yamanashiensis]|uniref:AB hydrolase-1 domain-containing protein n=1 Tax=Spirilliplanes yamanashiensis TaxID=42233 RepID=A0A8J3Y6G1_9ACTN|nr:alpha/beta fold hydrolase [Spirilliplanes yamanashiensis]MDP9814737.1 pimeloyl-ACP methyl ester carboxylesterase [Spirilliplanes yamanashiensis]GIJ02389.1 hypothetical protein Sya03_17410 [Spirilliplanes yamanashiensis]
MSGETMVQVNGVELCVESFGDPADPAVLLIAGGASSLDWWADEFCRRLAHGGRRVIRYDHRDTGRSTSYPAGEPGYTGADLAADPLALLDALGVHRAHVVGLSMGGGIAQRIAIEHGDRVATLTLMSTSPGDVEEEQEQGQRQEPPPAPDWTDPEAAVEGLMRDVRSAAGSVTIGEDGLRRLAERVVGRTRDMAASQVNHWVAEAGPEPKAGLDAVTAPTLVLHGTEDPLFSLAHGRALAERIAGARLVPLEGLGHEHPPPALWDVVVPEILRHTARG